MFFLGSKLANIGVVNPKHLKVLKSSKSLQPDLLFKLKSTPERTSQKNKSTSPKTTLIFINRRSIEPLQVFKHPETKTSPIAKPTQKSSSDKRATIRILSPPRKTCPDGTESATKLLLLLPPCRGQQNSATEQILPNLPGTPSTLVVLRIFPGKSTWQQPRQCIGGSVLEPSCREDDAQSHSVGAVAKSGERNWFSL